MYWVWWALWIAGGWIVLVNGFVSVFHAKAVEERSGIKLHPSFRYPILIFALVAYALDLLWNVTIGNFIFLERFREGTFSKRCWRHKHESTGWRRSRAIWWCDQLNKFDPDHC